MKLKVNYNKRVINEDGEFELTFTVVGYGREITELDKTKNYILDIKEEKEKRSIYQNKYMWKLIHNLAEKRGQDEWDIYIEAIERADVKCDYIACLPKAESILKKNFRYVKLMNTFEHNGKTFNQYKVYDGSSKFNVTEMNNLISIIQDMCEESGVEYEIDYI